MNRAFEGGFSGVGTVSRAASATASRLSHVPKALCRPPAQTGAHPMWSSPTKSNVCAHVRGAASDSAHFQAFPLSKRRKNPALRNSPHATTSLSPLSLSAHLRCALALLSRLMLSDRSIISVDPALAHGLSASKMHARSAHVMPHSALYLCQHLCRSRKAQGELGQTIVQCAGAALQRLDRS